MTGAAPLDLTTDGGDVDAGRQVDGSPAPASCVSAIACGDVCVDLRSDPQHCGTCETSCPAMVCNLGQCGDTCTAPLTSCSGGCIDVTASSAHCGACATACTTSQECSESNCVCPAGTLECGAGNCVDKSKDPVNCGACGVACLGGQVCNSGVCATTCSAGLTACSGSCVDLQSSEDHCGSCTQACGNGLTCIERDHRLRRKLRDSRLGSGELRELRQDLFVEPDVLGRTVPKPRRQDQLPRRLRQPSNRSEQLRRVPDGLRRSLDLQLELRSVRGRVQRRQDVHRWKVRVPDRRKCAPQTTCKNGTCKPM